MTDKIRRTINRFKADNGNANFTQKDMLQYLVYKIDKMEDKIVPRWVFVSCITGIVAFLGWLTNFVMTN